MKSRPLSFRKEEGLDILETVEPWRPRNEEPDRQPRSSKTLSLPPKQEDRSCMMSPLGTSHFLFA